jgi:membrane protease YdiL (CAAX protease family)
VISETFTREKQAWGPVATILWSVLIALIFLVSQTVTVFIYIVATRGPISQLDLPKLAQDLKYDGLLLSIGTFASALVCGPIILAIAKSKRGSNLREYLGLTLPNKRQTVHWLCAIIAFFILSDVICLFLGKPIVPEFMSKVYSSLEAPWILWLALLLAAPLSEELFFRGFLLRGLSTSPLGPYGAVLVSSVGWALMHVQYDNLGIVICFVLGLLLGAARLTTGSTVLTMFLHSFINLGAIAETAIRLHAWHW